MATTRLALNALGGAIESALKAALSAGTIKTPGQAFIGWPTSTKLSDILGEGSTQALVSIWPLKGKNTTRSKPTNYIVTPPTAGVSASLSSDLTTLTIGGAPKTGDVVHAFFGFPAVDAAYEVQASDTQATVAAAIAAAAEAYAIPGVTVTVNGAAVALAGALFSKVNVGGTGQLVREVARFERMVQVTVWCNDPDARLDIAGVITSNVGTAVQPFLYASDGTAVRCEVQDDPMNDDASSSYSTFKQDLFFRVEYGLTQVVTGTQIGGTQYQQTVNSNPTQTAYFG